MWQVYCCRWLLPVHKAHTVGTETWCSALVGSPLNNKEESAQRDFCPPKVIVGHCCCPMRSLSASEAASENGWQNTPEVLLLHRKLHLIESASKCLSDKDSLNVTMGYIALLSHPFICDTVCRALHAWCLQMYELLALVWGSSEAAPCDCSPAFTVFVSNCCLTWQTSPLKGTDDSVVEQLMICFSSLEQN